MKRNMKDLPNLCLDDLHVGSRRSMYKSKRVNISSLTANRFTSLNEIQHKDLALAVNRLWRMADRLNCVSWNIRGMNKIDKERCIHETLNRIGVDLAILCETRINASLLAENISKVLRDFSQLSISDSHHGGRILLVWSP